MDDLALLVDLHRSAKRQGPGGDDETRLAITLSGLRGAQGLRIADIGCGTGAQTLVLAKELDARITAIDFIPEFLDRLDTSKKQKGLDAQIKTLTASMDALPFEEQSLDAIWSEGAVYNIGFEHGIKAWRRFLKPDGVLAVSELIWLTHERPSELEQHWIAEYPEVATASAKLSILEENGYAPVGYFALSEQCWVDNYYKPLQERFPEFLLRNSHSEAARGIVKSAENEIALYARFSTFFSYGYFIAKRTSD